MRWKEVDSVAEIKLRRCDRYAVFREGDEVILNNEIQEHEVKLGYMDVDIAVTLPVQKQKRMI